MSEEQELTVTGAAYRFWARGLNGDMLRSNLMELARCAMRYAACHEKAEEAPASEPEPLKASPAPAHVKKGRGRPKKVETPEELLDSEAAAAPEVEAPKATEGADITLQEIRVAFGALIEAKGKVVAREVLSKFGASSLSELPVERYVPALAAAKEALA